MPNPTTANSAKVYFCDFESAWQRMQSLYVPESGEHPQRATTLQPIYRNASQRTISIAEIQPTLSAELFLSLNQHIANVQSITGLEPIFLTLLNALGLQQQDELFEQGRATWSQFSQSHEVVNDADLPVFYNVADRTLTFLSDKTFNSIRTGGPN